MSSFLRLTGKSLYGLISLHDLEEIKEIKRNKDIELKNQVMEVCKGDIDNYWSSVFVTKHFDNPDYDNYGMNKNLSMVVVKFQQENLLNIINSSMQVITKFKIPDEKELNKISNHLKEAIKWD